MSRTLRICFIGDSFVNGTGDPECLGWVGRVSAAARRAGHDLTVYNLGVRRETTADIAARWAREVAPRLPAGIDGRLVFSFGVNDTTHEHGRPRVEPEQSVANARAILTAARAAYPTLLVGPPPIGDDAAQNRRITALSGRFAAAARALGVPYLDTYAPLSASPVWRRETSAGDGAHPAAAGYAELAGLVAAWPAWQAWFAGDG